MEFDPHAQHEARCPYCGFNQAEGEHGVFEFRDMADGTVQEVICKPLVCVHHPLSHTRLVSDPPAN